MRVRSLALFASLAGVATLVVSCKTSGLRRVYISPTSDGLVERAEYAAGAPIYCIAEVVIGDPQTTVEVSMQPLTVGGQPTGLNPLLIAEHLPGKFTGPIATEFPKPSIQAIADPRDPATFTTGTATQTPGGTYRCVVQVDTELEYKEFTVLAGEAPTQDPNAPVPGNCKAETVSSCPLTSAASGIVRCCTATGSCGTGPAGTGFCYASH